MPNWCSNSFSMSGPTEVIDRVAQGISDGKMLQTMVDIGEWDYNTAVTQWGTKWEVSDVEVTLDDRHGEHAELHGYFESAWSPPKEAFFTFMSDNPDVDASLLYFEPAMDFCGDLDNELTVEDLDLAFLQNDSLGVQLDSAFSISEYLEDSIEEAQDEALAEPLTLEDPEEGLVITKGTI